MQSNSQRWSEIYEAGHTQVAPWDEVVSFVSRHRPDKPNNLIRILEVGCGCGSNLNFLNRSGYLVAGIDQDEKAIFNAAHTYYDQNPISTPPPDYVRGDFCSLPWKDDHFDLVIDRASLTYVSGDDLVKAVDEVNRVLKPGGRFLFTPYAIPGDWRTPFYLPQLFALMKPTDWTLLSVNRVDVVELMGENSGKDITSHYRVIAEKRKVP